MDILGGLTAAKLALDLVKDLKEIDKSVDEASFKLKLAELTSALADTKVALSDAKISLQEKNEEIEILRSSLDIAQNGDFCPKCRAFRLALSSSEEMLMGGLGRYGVEEWTFECENPECDFQTMKVQDPQGLVAKFIVKR